MNLKNTVLSSVKWTTGSSIVNSIVQIIQLSLLARLLSPVDFGLIAIAMVVIGFSQLFIDMGVSNAIIYKQQVSDQQLSTLYWLNVIIGAIFFGFLYLLAPIIGSFYKSPELIPVLKILSIIFLIKPWGQQFVTLLQKELEFDITSKIEILARVITFIFIVILAYKGFGAYSIAIGSVFYALLSTLGYVFFGRKLFLPQIHFKLTEVSEFLNFGLFQMGGNFLNYLSTQIDTIVIGKLLGVEILGIYNVAKDLTSKPYAVINPIITKITFPLLSKFNGDTINFKKLFLMVVKYLSLVNFPVYFLIALFAEEIVMFMFGIKWIDSILLIRILAFSFILRSIGSPAGSLLLSKGKANVSFYWGLVVFILYAFVLFIGSYWGLYGIAFGILLLQIILFFPNWKFIVYKYAFINFVEYMKAIFKPFAICLFSTFIVMFLNGFILKDVFNIIFLGLVYCIIYSYMVLRFEIALQTALMEKLPSNLVILVKRML